MEVLSYHSAEKTRQRSRQNRELPPDFSDFKFIKKNLGILAKLDYWMEELDIVPTSQFGFAAGLSASHALSALGSIISQQLQKKIPVLAVSFDIQKAYETMDHGLLIEKLYNCGFSEHWTRILFHLIQNRLFAAKIGENVSRVFRAVIGLPQGSTLAPTCFKFFIHDITQPEDGAE